MNLIKKISRLEKRIEQLENENLLLRQSGSDAERIKNEYTTKLKISEQRELEYNQIIENLKKEHEIYKKALKKLDFTISKINLNNKKALKEIRNNLKI